MSRTCFKVSISLDGFMAGPDQSIEHPLGVGGDQLHQWMYELEAWRAEHGLEGGIENESTDEIQAMFEDVGAIVMGRNMFGGYPGPWKTDPEWRGWWGENPPYHVPVYVVTHYPREPLPMDGGTTFHFVTDGFEAALTAAREAAGKQDVYVAGGANVIQQALAGGFIDDFAVSIAPALLGSGARLFENLPEHFRIEQTRSLEAPGVTHVSYRVLPR